MSEPGDKEGAGEGGELLSGGVEVIEEDAGRSIARERKLSNGELASRVARRYESKWIHYYVKWKVRLDPVYGEVAKRLESSRMPLLDIGCGVGVLAFYLREAGIDCEIRGVDLDGERLGHASRAIESTHEKIEFARELVEEIEEFDGNVALLDVVHYMKSGDRVRLLESIRSRMKPGTRLLLRTALSDGGWRARVTRSAERFAGLLGWMRMSTVDFPTLREIDEIFPEADFEHAVTPLWGRTPFNSFLLEYRRR